MILCHYLQLPLSQQSAVAESDMARFFTAGLKANAHHAPNQK
jgi:hypothetical protein